MTKNEKKNLELIQQVIILKNVPYLILGSKVES